MGLSSAFAIVELIHRTLDLMLRFDGITQRMAAGEPIPDTEKDAARTESKSLMDAWRAAAPHDKETP